MTEQPSPIITGHPPATGRAWETPVLRRIRVEEATGNKLTAPLEGVPAPHTGPKIGPPS